MKRMTFIWLVFLAFAPCSFVLSEESECIDLGNRRELFIDDYLVSKMTNVELITHRPERKNLAMIFDKPWEGDSQGYFAALYDGSIYRLYYHAWGQATNHPLTLLVLRVKTVLVTHPSTEFMNTGVLQYYSA